MHHGLVGDHVARDTSRDADGVESFAVHQPVNLDLARHIVGERRENGCQVVDRVVPDPRARRVRPQPEGTHLDAEVAVAAALDVGVGRLPQNGEVAGKQFGVGAGQAGEAVERLGDLFVVVPDPGDVHRGLGELCGELELNRDSRLHVDGATAPEEVDAVDALVASGNVVVDRYGVDMAGDHHSLVTSEIGAGNDRVAVPNDLEVVRVSEGHHDRVGNRGLIP